jgi:hypothetical protein
MRPPLALATLVVDERSPGNRLENMSSRPTTVVAHAARRKARQLLPCLRIVLQPRRVALARDQHQPLRAAGFSGLLERQSPEVRARAIKRVSAAVIDDLRLPGVIPLGPDGKLPDETVATEPLLAFVVLTRCSGPIWLRDREPALERMSMTRPVRLLLQPDLFRHVVERLGSSGWVGEMVDRAKVPGVWQ